MSGHQELSSSWWSGGEGGTQGEVGGVFQEASDLSGWLGAVKRKVDQATCNVVDFDL